MDRKDNMEIKTTIIIPNYNGLSFMEPCFESLKEQTVRDFKVLVVDNGSTDGSVEWLKEHRVPSIFLKENTGFSGAVNTGIRRADTPLCASFEQRYPGGAGICGGHGAGHGPVAEDLFRQQPG